MAKTKTSFLLKQNYQVIYAIVLILLIPITIILNTIWSVRSFQKNIDVGLQRQALTIGQMFNSSVYSEARNDEELQTKLEDIKSTNLELSTFDVLERHGEDFKIIASFDEEKVGRQASDLNYVIAWHQNTAVATLASGAVATGSPDGRFWEVVMPLTNEEGEKEALLSLRMSLSVMDKLAKDTLTKSYIILSITVLIVILLLALNTRLFEHAILFRKLKEVDKMKDEFISIASHELRTPITTIKGFLSMALEGDYGEISQEGTKGLKIMEASVNRLGVLVEDLLNVSRIEQNRLSITPVALNLHEILESLAAEFELRVKEKKLGFRLEFSAELPRVWADQDKLRQVLVNLIGNAVKYTKQGDIELIAKAEERFVTITVKDSGIGMTAKEREGLFEKFYRVKGEETKGIVGTGLGLWITKQLVELMGGEIFVDSIKHVGSQFYFTIPVYDKNTHKVEVKK